MRTRRRLRKAGTRERDRGCFARRSPAPDQAPRALEKDLAVTDDSSFGASIEGPDRACSGPSVEMDGSFFVRLRLASANNPFDGKRWLRIPLYGGPWSASPIDDLEIRDRNPDEDPCTGVRDPLPVPLLPSYGGATALVEESIREEVVA